MEQVDLTNHFNYLCTCLLKEQNSQGFWSGMLSSSALSTATSIVALQIHGNIADKELIQSGYNWLSANINPDGGFGDTPGSESNVSTSLLCYAAIYYCQRDKETGKALLNSIENFLKTKGIHLNSRDVAEAVLKFYGSDYTFSVPILSMLSLCGVLQDEAFRHIPALPFELSLVPASWYRFFNLQVVSYAIPALIGVGIYIHSRRTSKFSLPGIYRRSAVAPAIRKLAKLLPESGGFLEAIPLTAFVNMCLVASGHRENEVVRRGIVFLRNQQRGDGSWPIDTDLSTWVTTLSIKALGLTLEAVLGREDVQKLKSHLLASQYREKHPYNGSKPGGWGWTSFSGSVPDADDTAGAVLALLEMYEGTPEEVTAVMDGCSWLAGLQNSDGGFPTFCRGWGRLPFDSSCADLTGHAILAFVRVADRLGDKIPASVQKNFSKVVAKAADYLFQHQATDGHWIPLWFGSQLTDDKKNPVYGTAKVCIYLEDCFLSSSEASGPIPLVHPENPVDISMTPEPQEMLISSPIPPKHPENPVDISMTPEPQEMLISSPIPLVHPENPVDISMTPEPQEIPLSSSLSPELQDKLVRMTASARQFLLSQQNTDGSWGAGKGIPGTIEETCLAISALAGTHPDACLSGLEWLQAESRSLTLDPAPIGLYFATLWYTEKMYPLVFYIDALRRVLRLRGAGHAPGAAHAPGAVNAMGAVIFNRRK